jgi:hypothetical protein
VRLIKLLIRARQFNAALAGSDGVPFAAVAKQEGVSPSYFTRLVRLSYLAPDMLIRFGRVDALDQGSKQGTLACRGEVGPALGELRGSSHQLALRQRIEKPRCTVDAPQGYASPLLRRSSSSCPAACANGFSIPGSLALRLQQIEFLLEPLLGGFAGVDRRAEPLRFAVCRCSLTASSAGSGRSKHLPAWSAQRTAGPTNALR